MSLNAGGAYTVCANAWRMILLFGPRRSRGFRIFRLVYAIILILAVIALWLFVPAEVKKLIYETYINPP